MSIKPATYGNLILAGCLSSSLLLTGCATESHRTIAPQKVETANIRYVGIKTDLVVGNFQNRSNYMQGLFSSNVNRLGNQAKTILKTHLQQTKIDCCNPAE